MKQTLALVCNNFGRTHDGIGAYAAIMKPYYEKYFSVTVFTSVCYSSDNAFLKMVNMGMLKMLRNVILSVRERKFDFVLVEYPFVEWNPLILIVYHELRHVCNKTGTLLVLSLHEYDRVKYLRKKAIDLLLCADLVFVTNDKIKKLICEKCTDVRIREIPSTIEPVSFDMHEKKDYFTFFGLINSAKAFSEMVAGWKLFNSNGAYKLFILTSSEVDDIVSGCDDICVHKNADNIEVARVMAVSRFCILPIKPFVDEKNSTFKVGVSFGCIPIGKFCNEFSDLDFTVCMDSYSAESFKHAFEIATLLSEQEKNKMSCKAMEYGKVYAAEKIADKIACEIITKKKGRRDGYRC